MGGACCSALRRRLRHLQTEDQIEQRERFRLNHSNHMRGNLVVTHNHSIDNDFELISEAELGKGGCGVVVVGVQRQTHEKYAIKIVDKSSADINRLERELKLLKDVDHPNIVRLFMVYDSPEFMYFIMELCVGGHLGNLISRQYPSKYLDEARAKVLTRQLFSAIVHLHSRGIAHRDIKLQNILMDSANDTTAQVKLIDFGYGSRYIGALPMRTKCGTPYTTAPEVLKECYDERCDVWSAGVVVYIMLSGRRPFEALNITGPLADAGKAAMITNILAGRYHMNHEAFRSVSPLGLKFVTELLRVDYKSRMTSAEVLEHPWLTSLNVNISKSSLPPAMQTPKSHKAVENLKKMARSNPLKQAGSMAMVFGFQPRQAVEMRALFQSFDRDASGALSLDEFKIALKAIAPDLTDEDIQVIFRAVDINNDNEITYTEFLAATLDPMELDVGAVSRAFQLMDVNGDGYITAEELTKVLSVKIADSSSSKQSGRSKSKKPFKPSPPIQELPFVDQQPNMARLSGKSLSMGSLARSASMRGQKLIVSSAKSMMNLLSYRRGEDGNYDDGKANEQDNPDDDNDDDIDQRAMTLEERIKELMETCDVDHDGVISYAEFLWAMTGAKDVLGEINTLGPQMGDLPENFIPERLTSILEAHSSEMSLPQSIALLPLLDDVTPVVSRIDLSQPLISSTGAPEIMCMHSSGSRSDTLVLEDFAAPIGQLPKIQDNSSEPSKHNSGEQNLVDLDQGAGSCATIEVGLHAPIVVTELKRVGSDGEDKGLRENRPAFPLAMRQSSNRGFIGITRTKSKLSMTDIADTELGVVIPEKSGAIVDPVEKPSLGLGRSSSIRQLLAPPPFQSVAIETADRPTIGLSKASSIRLLVAPAPSLVDADVKCSSRAPMVLPINDGIPEKAVLAMNRSASSKQIMANVQETTDRPTFLGLRASSLRQLMSPATIFPTSISVETSDIKQERDPGARLQEADLPPLLNKTTPASSQYSRQLSGIVYHICDEGI